MPIYFSNLSIFITLLFFFLLPACNEKNFLSEINRAEQCMISQPDSSLQILENIYTNYSDFNNKEKALFGILYFQATDKNYLELPAKELIDFSIGYYTRKKNNSALTTAMLYKARALRYQEKYEEAMQWLLKAKKQAQPISNYDVAGKIYHDLGDMCYYKDLFDDAHRYYMKAAACFEQLNDTAHVVNALVAASTNFAYNENYDSALYYGHKALNMVLVPIQTGYVLLNLSHIYLSEQQYDSAMYYARQCFHYPCHDHNQAVSYLTLAEIYWKNNQYEFALECAENAKKYPMDMYAKRDYYRILHHIYNHYFKDTKSAAHYFDVHQTYEDSIRKLEKYTEISKLEEIQLTEESLVKQERNKNIIVFVSSLILCGIALCVVWLIFFYNKKNNEKISRILLLLNDRKK